MELYSLKYLMIKILPIILYCSVPGICGGIGTFLFSLKKGHYKNNRKAAKFTIEILGAGLTSLFVGPLFPEKVRIFASFAIGLSWAGLIQVVRLKITKLVRAAIGEAIR